MQNFDREIAKVDKILTGNFSSKSDKEYWINKKTELENKRAAYENNLKYYKKNKKWDR